MNKADVERALKRCTGAALKPVYVRNVSTGSAYRVFSVTYDPEVGLVYINATFPENDSTNEPD